MIVDLTDETDLEEKIKEASHEIKNQLSVLDVYLRIIEKQIGKNKNIDVIKKATANIVLQLNDLRSYEENEVKEIILQDVINDSVHMFEEVVKENNNKLVLNNSINYDIKLFAEENKLLSVFNNIIKNANESTKDDEIEIFVDIDNGSAIVDITNHGDVIEEEKKKLIFEKGYTTKKKGNGIGLYACKNYIKEFGGKIELLTSNEAKTTFRISLPLN